MRVLVDTCVIIDALQSRVRLQKLHKGFLYILQISSLRDISRQSQLQIYTI